MSGVRLLIWLCMVTQIVGSLIGRMGDEAVQVRDSTAWTIDRICEHVPSVLLTAETLPPLLAALGAGLEGEPRVATNVCWVSCIITVYVEGVFAQQYYSNTTF